MNIISVSYGNDSIAMIQWASENKLENVHVVYVDTGWAHPSWPVRVNVGNEFAKKCGFSVHNIGSDIGFIEMVRMKKGFPFNGAQFCTGILKWLPFAEWCSVNDPNHEATIFIGKRRVESQSRKDTPLWIFKSEIHENRDVCHPLYLHSDYRRNLLVEESGIEVLPHRSKECSPCVNSNREDFLMVDGARIYQIRELEKEVGHNMFRAYRHMGASGIDEVLRWARTAPGIYDSRQFDMFECMSGMCGD